MPEEAGSQKQVKVKRKLSTSKKIIFSLVLFLILFVLFELTLRLAYPLFFSKPGYQRKMDMLFDGELGGGYFPVFKPHLYSLFTLREDHQLADGEYVHNVDSFRGPTLKKEKDPEVFRIAILGGSTTYNNGVPYLFTYGAYLEEILSRSFPDKRIEVLNAGVPGYSSAESFSRFHFNVLDYDPDMVVVYHGINDVWPRLFTPDLKNDFSNSKKIMKDLPPPSQRQILLMKIFYSYRLYYWIHVLDRRIPDLKKLTFYKQYLHKAKENVENNKPIAFERNISDIVYICKGREIEPVLVTMALDEKELSGKDWHKALIKGTYQHNDVLRKIAKEQNVTLNDLDKTMPRSKGIFGDICHVTSRGSMIKAKLISESIIPILEKRFKEKAQAITDNFTDPKKSRSAEISRYINGEKVKITKEMLKNRDMFK